MNRHREHSENGFDAKNKNWFLARTVAMSSMSCRSSSNSSRNENLNLLGHDFSTWLKDPAWMKAATHAPLLHFPQLIMDGGSHGGMQQS